MLKAPMLALANKKGLPPICPVPPTITFDVNIWWLIKNLNSFIRKRPFFGK